MGCKPFSPSSTNRQLEPEHIPLSQSYSEMANRAFLLQEYPQIASRHYSRRQHWCWISPSKEPVYSETRSENLEITQFIMFNAHIVTTYFKVQYRVRVNTQMTWPIFCKTFPIIWGFFFLQKWFYKYYVAILYCPYIINFNNQKTNFNWKKSFYERILNILFQ